MGYSNETKTEPQLARNEKTVLPRCLILKNMKPAETSVNQATDPQKPEPGVRYWVQCPGYRTLAVLNAAGKWCAFCDGHELPEVISFSEAD